MKRKAFGQTYRIRGVGKDGKLTIACTLTVAPTPAFKLYHAVFGSVGMVYHRIDQDGRMIKPVIDRRYLFDWFVRRPYTKINRLRHPKIPGIYHITIAEDTPEERKPRLTMFMILHEKIWYVVDHYDEQAARVGWDYLMNSTDRNDRQFVA